MLSTCWTDPTELEVPLAIGEDEHVVLGDEGRVLPLHPVQVDLAVTRLCLNSQEWDNDQ